MNPATQVILGSVGAIVASRLGAWYGARKARAEIDSSDANTAKTLVDTAIRLLEPYEHRIDELERRDRERRETVRRLHGRVDRLDRHVDDLEARLRTAGIEYPARPPDQETRL